MDCKQIHFAKEAHAEDASSSGPQAIAPSLSPLTSRRWVHGTSPELRNARHLIHTYLLQTLSLSKHSSWPPLNY